MLEDIQPSQGTRRLWLYTRLRGHGYCRAYYITYTRPKHVLDGLLPEPAVERGTRPHFLLFIYVRVLLSNATLRVRRRDRRNSINDAAMRYSAKPHV